MLTRGGDAELVDMVSCELLWRSSEDEDFLEAFPDFLTLEHVLYILEYLEACGELSKHEADHADIVEEFADPAELAAISRSQL